MESGDEVAGVSRAAVLDSSLRHLTTAGVVFLHIKMQLGLVAISDDSTSCLLGLTVHMLMCFALI